jgi:hypothetical protein
VEGEPTHHAAPSGDEDPVAVAAVPASYSPPAVVPASYAPPAVVPEPALPSRARGAFVFEPVEAPDVAEVADVFDPGHKFADQPDPGR